MVLANRDMNHGAENFHETLNISADLKTLCRERVFFTAFSNSLQRYELYEDLHQDSPVELRTVSGDLQRCLRSISDPLQYEYTLLIFIGAQRASQKAFSFWLAERKAQSDPELQKKIEILRMLEELRDSVKTDDDDEDSQEPLIEQLNDKNMNMRVNLVKQSQHSFETYMNMLNRWAGSNISVPKTVTKDVQSMLTNLFSKNDE